MRGLGCLAAVALLALPAVSTTPRPDGTGSKECEADDGTNKVYLRAQIRGRFYEKSPCTKRGGCAYEYFRDLDFDGWWTADNTKLLSEEPTFWNADQSMFMYYCTTEGKMGDYCNEPDYKYDWNCVRWVIADADAYDPAGMPSHCPGQYSHWGAWMFDMAGDWGDVNWDYMGCEDPSTLPDPVDTMGEASPGVYCHYNWSETWANKSIKSVEDCKADCLADSTCKAIVTGTYDEEADICIKCTSNGTATAPGSEWATYYKKKVAKGYGNDKPKNSCQVITDPWTCQNSSSGDEYCYWTGEERGCQIVGVHDPCARLSNLYWCKDGGSYCKWMDYSDNWDPRGERCTNKCYLAKNEGKCNKEDLCLWRHDMCWFVGGAEKPPLVEKPTPAPVAAPEPGADPCEGKGKKECKSKDLKALNCKYKKKKCQYTPPLVNEGQCDNLDGNKSACKKKKKEGCKYKKGQCSFKG